MSMKSLLKIIHTVIIAIIVLHSCNSEVFISDFAPSVSEVQLSEKDPVSEIYFESSNWDIQSVYDMDENGNNHTSLFLRIASPLRTISKVFILPSRHITFPQIELPSKPFNNKRPA